MIKNVALLSVMSNPIAIPPHHQSNRSVWIGTQQDTRKFIRKGFIKIHASPAQHSYAEIASPFAPLSSDFQASSKAPRPSPGHLPVPESAQSSWSMVARYSAERPRRRCSGRERSIFAARLWASIVSGFWPYQPLTTPQSQFSRSSYIVSVLSFLEPH